MTTLVTGASSGLGAEFARQLAARGDDLVLVARSVDRLDALAGELRERFGVRVDVFAHDLSHQGAPERVTADLARIGITIDLLVNNAGFGTAGRFEEISAGRDTEQLMVNVVSVVGLTRLLVPAMLARGGGGVINVSSTAGLQPSPYFAAYAAAKTFVLNFSLALREEYRGRDLRVLALCPGPTRTAFFDSVGERAAIGARMMPADEVVRKALRAYERDRGYVVPGLGNAVNAHLSPRRPRRLVTAIAKRVTRGVLRTA